MVPADFMPNCRIRLDSAVSSPWPWHSRNLSLTVSRRLIGVNHQTNFGCIGSSYWRVWDGTEVDFAYGRTGWALTVTRHNGSGTSKTATTETDSRPWRFRPRMILTRFYGPMNPLRHPLRQLLIFALVVGVTMSVSCGDPAATAGFSLAPGRRRNRLTPSTGNIQP